MNRVPAEVIVVLNAYVLFGINDEHSELRQLLLLRRARRRFKVCYTDRLVLKYNDIKQGFVGQIQANLRSLGAIKQRGGRVTPTDILHLRSQHDIIVSEACSIGAHYLITVNHLWLGNERLRNHLRETHGVEVINPDGFLREMERR